MTDQRKGAKMSANSSSSSSNSTAAEENVAASANTSDKFQSGKADVDKAKEQVRQDPLVEAEDDEDEEEDGKEENSTDQNDGEKENSGNTSSKKGGDNNDKKGSKKSRRELPPHTVAILKGWMLSPEHVKHPYPTDEDKQMLLKKTGINMKQLTNWFTNARKRIWKPMMRREHSRQMQNSLAAEQFQGTSVPPQNPTYTDSGHQQLAVGRSFDAGSNGPPQERVPFQACGRPHVNPMYSESGYAGYAPRSMRSMSESATIEGGEYGDMRYRKRPFVEVGEDNVGADKRFRRSAIMSPRCLKILQEFAMVKAGPSEQEKLQLSRETGLDVAQIELWFKNNKDRLSHPNQIGASGSQSADGRPLSAMSAHEQSSYPPAYYGQRSIPGSGNPMFPPRPTSGRSSIPGPANPQFPPPPHIRRDSSGDGYRPPPAPYAATPGRTYGSAELQDSRPARCLSINNGQSYSESPSVHGRSQGPRPNVLPSLSSRNLLGRASGGPTMGQTRDGRSHTIDMGLFSEARRRKMNFQDVLSCTSAPTPVQAPNAPPQRPSLSSVDFNRMNPQYSLNYTNDHTYPATTPSFNAKGFGRELNPSAAGCRRCGSSLAPCPCQSTPTIQEQSRIV